MTQPPEELQDVVRTYFPAGTRDGLSVPIVRRHRRGVAVRGPGRRRRRDGPADARAARVDPAAGASGSAPSSSAWATARSRSPEGSSQGNLDAGDAFDPDGVRPVPELYALERRPGRDRRPSAPSTTPSVRSGEEGYDAALHRRQHLRLARRRQSRPTAPSSTSRPTEAPDGEVTTAVTGAVDLAAPALGLPRPRVGARPQRAGGRGSSSSSTAWPARVAVPGVTRPRRSPSCWCRATAAAWSRSSAVARPTAWCRPAIRHDDGRRDPRVHPAAGRCRCPRRAARASATSAGAPPTIDLGAQRPHRRPARRCARSRSTGRPARS